LNKLITSGSKATFIARNTPIGSRAQ
jgi:hypothetical protein